MVKLRIMCTPNDIKWFVKLIHRHKKIKVNCTSDNLPVKGSNRYKRVHMEIEKNLEEEQ
ncbi:MAG: hypothetical protein K6E47_08895 [Lachnospiraceae bacterium]|nr:hypothetical protein [Lachnospiraceae bacterium]